MDEAVASIFHTVLFHRTLGKFRYKEEGNYSVGTIGYSDVDCDFIDFTYVSGLHFQFYNLESKAKTIECRSLRVR